LFNQIAHFVPFIGDKILRRILSLTTKTSLAELDMQR